MSINVTQPSVVSAEEYYEEIKSIFDTKILTNMGPVYKKLQKQLMGYLGVQELSLFVNGHMALEMAIQTMNFPKNSEIITTPYTFVSTTHAITRNGLVPRFCDINTDDYTIDVNKIEPLINERTVAILPVHVYGNVCDIEGIQKIADRYNLKVIYDAAHAFGVTYKGVGIGNYGDMSMFSFHATKVFNTIEGGAVAFRNKAYATRLHELKNFGIHDEDSVVNVGGNAKLDEFRAAMGICNLRHLDDWIARRKKISERYDERLSGTPGLRFIKLREGVEHNYAYYPVYIDHNEFGKTRDELYAALKDKDIHVRKYFYPAVNDMDCYKETGDDTPAARDVSLNILTLPMYSELTLEDVDKVCDVILSV